MLSTMKIALAISLGSFITLAMADSFEPTDFDVVEALINNGVDVSAVPGLTDAESQRSSKACSVVCTALKTWYGEDAILSEGSSAYEEFTSGYWSAQQNAVNPYCVFKPTNAVQVSTLVLLSRLTQCPFAVKGGGHAAFAGSSSSEGGITVALEKMDEVTVSDDKKTAAVGPGNRWAKVYQTLEAYGLEVIGGRIASVGVPGLVLGGGISHFANKYGWACDNVESYEVVTASGLIVNASPTSYPDLYWALRGGGNNFGIVTKFIMRTIVQGPMWGGQKGYFETEWEAVLDAYYNVAKDAASDLKQAQILTFARQNGTNLAAVDFEYSDPTPWPSIFDAYKPLPAFFDGTGVKNLSDLVLALGAGAPDDFQETYWDMTFKLDRELMGVFVTTFFSMLTAVQDAPGMLSTFNYQAITVPAMEAMQQNGGNALGLDPSKGPVFIVNLANMWSDSADNERIMKFSNDLYKRLVEIAGERDLNNDFIYMNYASQYQDPVASYGAANKQKLKGIASKYDPTAVFQKLQPGYFKLEGAPAGAFPA